MHVDEFIEDHKSDDYAAFMLHHMRLPAVQMHRFKPLLGDRKLFCTYCGTRWRVTGASRLGDVWLASDFKQDCGYDRRVDVAECSAWGAKP